MNRPKNFDAVRLSALILALFMEGVVLCLLGSKFSVESAFGFLAASAAGGFFTFYLMLRGAERRADGV
jgi:hypothetical protein